MTTRKNVRLTNAIMQVWDAFEGGHLFTGRDPELHVYRGRAHLAEIIALLGPPPPSLLARANLRSKFFNEEGESPACLQKSFYALADDRCNPR